MSTEKRPNVLVIVADDLGFSDLGCFGGEIRTPNLDKIATNGGIRFTDFHAAAACSPSRAMIMTGTDHHIAGLGNLVEWLNLEGQNAAKGSKVTTGVQRGMPGYEGYLNEKVVALPEVLRDSGYFTCMSGKWHLGLTPERSPHRRGFDKSFAHLPACSNHYAFEPDYKEGDEVPTFLEASYIALHQEDGEYVRKLPDDWYSSNGYGDKMVEYLDHWKEGEKKDSPFFGYYAFTAPHWPLQAPQEFIKHYRGVYDDGPEALRQKRLQRLKELGMIKEDVVPHPVVAEEEYPEWETMDSEQKIKSARAMEVFAGMVECIDYNVGKVLDKLEAMGELDNTFVCFMSDNGAEGAAYEAYPLVKNGAMQHLLKYYDNSLDNLGNGNSFIWYGPRWAQASTAPSRLYKAYTTEGGVKVPFLAKYPKNMNISEQSQGITHQFATVMDLAPTIIEMAGAKHPAPQYQGREVVEMRGKSMCKWITGSEERVHDKEFVQGWETCGRAALRFGDWKIVFIPKPKGPEKWQLYNLTDDPGEINDLAEEKPEKLEQLKGLWDVYVLETGVVPLTPELGNFIEKMEEQMKENVWMEYDYWKPGARDEPEKFTRKPWRYNGTAMTRTIKQF